MILMWYLLIEESSEDDEDDEDGVNIAIEVDDSNESSDVEETVEEADEEDRLDDKDESEEYKNMRYSGGPGSQSGCTAIVALLREKELYVANAGDCRCVVSRNGNLLDISKIYVIERLKTFFDMLDDVLSL